MSPDERAIMQRHVAYWTDLMHRKVAIVFGPVFDPSGAYGVGIVEVAGETELRNLLSGDPATTLNRYEWWPMRAVHPGQAAPSV